MGLDNLNGFLNDIEKLKKAHDILEEIWIEIGPYDKNLSSGLSTKLNNYFDFDDSE